MWRQPACNLVFLLLLKCGRTGFESLNLGVRILYFSSSLLYLFLNEEVLLSKSSAFRNYVAIKYSKLLVHLALIVWSHSQLALLR